MELTLVRDIFGPDYTLGKLYADGSFLCYTVEDAVREIEGEPVAAWKIPGKTAIPYGRYKVIITFSNKFQKLLPLIVDVPGYTGVRFHALNYAEESDGCIGPGMTRMDRGVANSRLAMSILHPMIQEAKETWLSIKAA